jgi:poly-beta-1,6-N-acetyl-D-glucosamine synthase
VAVIASIVFLASLVFCIYTLAGYPLLLAFLSRRPRPVLRRMDWRTVSVVLPVRNGDRWIAQKLNSILELDYPRDLIEILVVSDGSTDRTEDIVRGFLPHQHIRLFPVAAGGKAQALNFALAQATGEILFFTDVRQKLAADSLRRLVECFADPAVGVVSGELVILDGATHEEANTGLYWLYEKWIRKRLSALDSVPGASGCIYAMRRELATTMPPGTLNDDMYLPLAAFLRGYRVIFDESARAYDLPTALQTEFRRKVRTLGGNYQIIRYFPALLARSNRMRLHFLSHKLARLFMPYPLIAMAIAAWWLPVWLAPAAIASQALFYALAAIDGLLPEHWFVKRITSPARTFVVLMAASLFAVSVFFLPGQALWKETRVSEAAR